MSIVCAKLEALFALLQKEVRVNLIPGGEIGVPYLVKALIYGILYDFVDPNVVPALPDYEAKRPVDLLDLCLSRLDAQGIRLTETEIRNMIAQREEDEKNTFISYYDKMEPEQKAMELRKKKLGMGEQAVANMKAIYTLDPETLEREKAKRLEAGIVDFAADPNQARYYEMFGYGGDSGGGGGGDDGYDMDQGAWD
jgi:hypothetical protein